MIIKCVSDLFEINTNSMIVELATHRDKQKTENVIKSLKGQITALEILTNLSSDDAYEDAYALESDEDIEDDNSDGMDAEAEVDMSAELKPLIDQIVNNNLISKILEMTRDIEADVRNKLLENESGKQIYDLQEKLLIDSYLCLSNITEIMNIAQLGGGENVKNIWLQLCSRLCSTTDNTDLADGLSCVVRSFTCHVCKAEAGVSLDNVGIDDLEMLVKVYSSYSSEEAANIRTNIVNILGNFGCVATRNISDQSCAVVITKLATWILEIVVNDTCLRVALEGLDKFIDVFGADETDKIFAEQKLTPKLKHILSTIKARISKEKKMMSAEDVAVANTVKLNLQRFVNYKEKRVKNLM